MRIRLIAALVLGTTAAVQAQELTVGVHGGVNLARPELDDGAEGGLKTQPVVGASAELGFGGGLGLRVEVEYLRRGGTVTVIPAGLPPMATSYSLTYLALPVNLRYELGTGTVGAFAFAGTTFGALLAANQRREGAGVDEDVSDELSGIDITLDLGGGVRWHVSPAVALVLDGRYSLGLRETARDDAVLATGSWKARDIKVTLGVTYTFGARPAPQMSMPFAPAMPPAP